LIPHGVDNRILVVHDVADRHKKSLECEESKRVPGALKMLLQLGKTQLRMDVHRPILSSDNNTAEGLKIISRTGSTKDTCEWAEQMCGSSFSLKESQMSEDHFCLAAMNGTGHSGFVLGA